MIAEELLDDAVNTLRRWNASAMRGEILSVHVEQALHVCIPAVNLLAEHAESLPMEIRATMFRVWRKATLFDEWPIAD